MGPRGRLKSNCKRTSCLKKAKRRDHRTVGKEMGLFSLQQDEAGGGLVFWHPKGALMRHQIETFWKDLHLQRGYDLVSTPHVAKSELENERSQRFLQRKHVPTDASG